MKEAHLMARFVAAKQNAVLNGDNVISVEKYNHQLHCRRAEGDIFVR